MRTPVIALLTATLLLAPAALHAGSPVKVSGTAILQSAYLWRGEKVCEVNFNPVLEASIGGFTAQAFAYLPFDGSYKEIDMDFFYTLGPWSLHVADYFIRFAADTAPENFFDWRKQSTNHIMEGIMCYAPRTVPIEAKWFTFFYGDWIPEPDGSRGKTSFSSYLELIGYHDFDKAGRVSLVGGASILKGPYTLYTKDFALIHCELRYTNTIDLGGVKLPVGVSWLLNPYARRVFMNASVGISF
ncbi:MAG: hypothetical protein J6O51_03115 [Bacteroidales bacterium]|nr:hypothetical protein [Bacteroidales bacterium]